MNGMMLRAAEQPPPMWARAFPLPSSERNWLLHPGFSCTAAVLHAHWPRPFCSWQPNGLAHLWPATALCCNANRMHLWELDVHELRGEGVCMLRTQSPAPFKCTVKTSLPLLAVSRRSGSGAPQERASLMTFRAATPATPQDKPHYATVMGGWDRTDNRVQMQIGTFAGTRSAPTSPGMPTIGALGS